MLNKIATVMIGILLVGLAVLLLSAKNSSFPNQKIAVVAAENFWGSLASQIGGNKVEVYTIISDPNADPHEYASNTANARAVARANLVIENGAGYDAWANSLLNANPGPDRKVLNVADLLGKKNGDNPHFWYDPEYVNKVVLQMESDLIAIDPMDSGYFASRYREVISSLLHYQKKIQGIKNTYAGTNVASTEDVFAYLADSAGLNLISPSAFTEAVAEGNDPPASSIVTFQEQLENKEVKVLVYNTQTITPLTDSMKQLALRDGIPVIGMSETIQPSNSSFQDWMSVQVTDLVNALNTDKLHTNGE